jgi:hypothetical protein
MIYLGTHFNDTYLLPVSHHFYCDGNFYSVSPGTEDSIYKSVSKYYIRTENGIYEYCEKFEYELPSVLIYIGYSKRTEKIEVLDKLVINKILDSI